MTTHGKGFKSPSPCEDDRAFCKSLTGAAYIHIEIMAPAVGQICSKIRTSQSTAADVAKPPPPVPIVIVVMVSGWIHGKDERN